MQTDLIIINDFCDRCHVDPSFIMELEEDGLIEVRVIDEERYLPTSQLAELERYTHLYYDLSINMEGIDAIHHLLQRMEEMQRELHELRSQLRLFRLYLKRILFYKKQILTSGRIFRVPQSYT